MNIPGGWARAGERAESAGAQQRGERAFGAHGWWRVVALLSGVAAFGVLHAVSDWPSTLVLLEAAVGVLFLLPAWKPASLWIGAEYVAALVWWFVGGHEASRWWAVALAASLALQLLAVAWSAQAPPWAGYAPGMLRRRLITASAYLALCVVAMGVVAAMALLGPALGPIAVVVGTVALLAALCWVIGALRH